MLTYKKDFILTGLLAAAIGLSLTSCSSSSTGGGGGGNTSPFSSTIGQSTEKLNNALKAADLIKDSSVAPLTAIGSNWTQASGVLSFDSGNVSLQEWFGDFFNFEYERSNGSRPTPFGKFRDLTSVLCAVGETAAKDTDGLPTIGSQTVTLTAAVIDLCDIGGVSADTPVQITVSNPGGSIYQRQIDMNVGNTNRFLFGTSGSVIRLAFSEVGSPADTSGNRVIAKLDQSSGDFMVETISQSNGGEYILSRVIINGSNGHARVLSHFGTDTNTHFVRFVATGTITDTTTDQVALSLAWSGYSGGGLANGSGEACINPQTGGIVTDNTLACNVHTGANVSGSAGMIETARTTFSTDASVEIDGSTDFSFANTTDMLTAAP